MNCKDFAEFLDEYLAGEQPAEIRAVFESHLTDCECCKHYLKGYEETIKLGKSLCEEPCTKVPDKVPDQLVKAVMAAIEAGRESKSAE